MPTAGRADVLRALAARVDDLAQAGVAALRETLPAYRPLPAAELLPGVRADLDRGLRALAERRGPLAEELAAVDRVAEQRARQAVPLDEMLQGFQRVARLVWRAAQRAAEECGLPAAETLSLVDDIWAWLDVVTVRAAQAHRRVEVEAARGDESQRVAFLRGLLRGSLAPAQVHARLATWGLPAEVPYLAFRARPLRDLPARDCVRRLGIPSGLVAVLDDSLVGITTIRPRIPQGEVAVGVGEPVPLGDLPQSYAAASRALEAAGALGLTGDVSLADLGLLAAVASEPEVGDELVRRLLEPLAESRAMSGELTDSLRAYLDADLSVEAAARELVVHPNTLRYRLKRAEELAGVNLHHTQDLVQLWWALQRKRIQPAAWGSWTG